MTEFQETVWNYYHRNGRDLPWRRGGKDGSFDPYKILVSEIMLQQTQAQRVIPKFLAFVEEFPTVQSLAASPLANVLTLWNGLGYNRRAKYLWQAAHEIVTVHKSKMPSDVMKLITLPGVGANTAGAIIAYSYNKPVVFIETNIRTVFIYHFFEGQEAVPDTAILPLVKQSLDHENPREWYWALMDYGSYLKQTKGNHGRYSKHHVKQSRFEGSRREIRGLVVKALTKQPLTKAQLARDIVDSRLEGVLQDLVSEGLIQRYKNNYRL